LSSRNSSYGSVYVLSNPSLADGLLKIGYTQRSIEERMAELYATGVAAPFCLEYSVEFDQCSVAERAIHRTLKSYRQNKEFFKCSVVTAIYAIESLGLDFHNRYSRHDYFVELRAKQKIENQIEEKNRIQRERERKILEVREEEERIRLQLLSRSRTDLFWGFLVLGLLLFMAELAMGNYPVRLIFLAGCFGLIYFLNQAEFNFDKLHILIKIPFALLAGVVGLFGFSMLMATLADFAFTIFG
jgi:hypothetical protein